MFKDVQPQGIKRKYSSDDEQSSDPEAKSGIKRSSKRFRSAHSGTAFSKKSGDQRENVSPQKPYYRSVKRHRDSDTSSGSNDARPKKRHQMRKSEVPQPKKRAKRPRGKESISDSDTDFARFAKRFRYSSLADDRNVPLRSSSSSTTDSEMESIGSESGGARLP
ncbi:hypothetical protein Plec18170_009715 [Paecilomyces lecythidis]